MLVLWKSDIDLSDVGDPNLFHSKIVLIFALLMFSTQAA